MCKVLYTSKMCCIYLWARFCFWFRFMKPKFKRLNSRNNEYIYGIWGIINLVCVLYSNRVLVWISQPKRFEMEFLKMAHLTFLTIFHLKVIIFQIFKLPHIYGHCRKKPHLWYMIIIKFFTWLTNLFQSYGITMFSRYYKFYDN